MAASAPRLIHLQEAMVLTPSAGTYRAGRYGVRLADVHVVPATGGVPVVPAQ